MTDDSNEEDRKEYLEKYLAENRRRFEEKQKEDGFPDEECGIVGHCYECHCAYSSIEAYKGGPNCGHWVGCPEC